jgi:hypothetical protein
LEVNSKELEKQMPTEKHLIFPFICEKVGVMMHHELNIKQSQPPNEQNWLKFESVKLDFFTIKII